MDEQQAPLSTYGSTSTLANRPKSPPLAFEPTANDALYSQPRPRPLAALPPADMVSPPASKYSPSVYSGNDLELQVERQANALYLQHQAFAAERECWHSERARLQHRIEVLEAQFATANGHSLVNSPAVSPHEESIYSPPSARASASSSRLASIAEHDLPAPMAENKRVSCLKRDGVPPRIDLSTVSAFDGPNSYGPLSADALTPDTPFSPPATRQTLSPPPPKNRHLAGHTPLKVPDRPTFDLSPTLSNFSDRTTDTPTKLNTKQNILEAQRDGLDDEDRPLKGPLFMPELPNQLGEEHFSLDALCARLKYIEEDPDENQPMVLRRSGAHYYSDSDDDELAKLNADIGAKHKLDLAKDLAFTERVFPDSAPPATGSRSGSSGLDTGFNAPSPPPPVASGEGSGTTSRHSQHDLDHGGIKLRKKQSSNFGAPLGQLRMFGEGSRKFY